MAADEVAQTFPTVLVIEAEQERRHALARILGPGTLGLSTVEEAADWLEGSTVAREASRGKGSRWAAGVPVVVVTGPSLAPTAALTLCDRWPHLAVVAVHGRASTVELRTAVYAGVADLVGADAPAPQLRHAVRRAGVVAECVGNSGERSTRPLVAVATAALPDVGPEQIPISDHGEGAHTPNSGLIAVLAPKGGVGGTTVAVNLALALSGLPPTVLPNGSSGSPVAVVVDADLQFGDVALLAGVDPRHTLASLAPAHRRDVAAGVAPFSSAPDATAVGRTLLAIPDTAVAVLAAPVDPALAETISASLLGDVLDLLAGFVPWVVVDVPAVLDDRSIEVLDRAGHVVVVTTPDPLAVKAAGALVDLLDRLEVAAPRTVVCNAPHRQISGAPGVVEQQLGRRVAVAIAHDESIPAAVVRGRPLLVCAPTAPAARAISALATYLRRPAPPGAEPGPPVRHFLERVFEGARRSISGVR